MAADNRISLIRSRLLPEPPAVDDPSIYTPDWQPAGGHPHPPIDAAVLIPVVKRGAALSVLYTLRASSLRAHSGQIAFPGGKVDPEDETVAHAALREAFEEVSLAPDDADILGYMPPYYSGTNYLITPVVAVVEPRAPFVANPLEVDEVFEVPLPLIANSETYGTYRLTHGTREFTTWQIDHEGRVIWGITANLTRNFRDTVLLEDGIW